MQRLLTLFFLFLHFFTDAQKLSEYTNTTFITDFPQNTVQALYQDNKGYMWIGTESGLNMYDGKRVYNYKRGVNDNFFLTGKIINNITADQKGRLWVATSEGISIFNPLVSLAQNEENRKLSEKINTTSGLGEAESIKVLKNQKVVIGFRGGLVLYSPAIDKVEVLKKIVLKDREVSPFFVCITEDENSDILALEDKEGLFQFDNNLQIKKHFKKEEISNNKHSVFHNMVYTGSSQVFIATNYGLIKFNLITKQPLDVFTQKNRNPDFSSLEFNHLAYSPVKNVIVAGSNTKGFFVLDTSGNIIDHVYDNYENTRLYSNVIYYTLPDKDNLGWWIGNGQGLVRLFYNENLFSTQRIHNADNSPMRIYPIFSRDNQEIYIGTNTHLVTYNNKTGKKTKFLTDLNVERRFNHILQLNKDFFIFCTKQGLYYCTNLRDIRLKKMSSIYPELSIFDSINILCAAKVTESSVLFGLKSTSMGGLIKWSLKEKKVERFDERKDDLNSLSNNTVNNIVRRNDGQYFICTNTGVSLFNNETNKTTRLIMPGKNGLNYPQVNTILEDGDSIWIGTYGGGLNIYYPAKNITEYLTEKEGLANNDIYAIYKTPDNRLWISTNNGISVYDLTTKRFRNFDKSNGLLDNEFNRNSNFQLGDTLYFGGITGLCYFNYKNIMSSSVAPFVDITKITFFDKGVEKIIFPDKDGWIKTSFIQSTIKLYLSSPFYINPAKTNFKYRLLPGQTDWISNGTNNELILTHLPPGKHTLEVISISSEGVDSYNTKQLFIHITPPWYQTNLFKIFLGVFAAGILFSFYRLRLNQIKKELQIRNQLASDLHDDLGSTLNSVKVYSNLAIMEKENPQHLLRVKESTQDAIAGVRDLIWVLDDKKDNIQDLLSRVNQFAAPLCEANHINYVQNISDNLYHYKLGKEEKRNLYMIAKESVNNSVKYATCRNIELSITDESKKIQFSIRDDGNGFDKEKIKAGNGLKNIATRAKEIGYSSNIVSSEGNGTTIVLRKS